MNNKTMTVKEVAEALDLDPRTVQLKAKELYPERVRNGLVTNLTETEVTTIKMHLEKKFEVKTDLEKKLIISQAIHFLQEDIKSLQQENKQLKADVKMLVHDFDKCYTTTEIAKELHLRSAQSLNLKLQEMGIQYRRNNTWCLHSQFSSKELTSTKQQVLENGMTIYDRQWTGEGRKFILDLFAKNLVQVGVNGQ